MLVYTTKEKVVHLLNNKTVSDVKQEWIEWATDEIESRTGESYFEAQTETLDIDGPGDKTLIIPRYPIIEITSLVCDGVTFEGADLAQFAIYYDEGIISVKEGLNIDYFGLDEVFAKGTKNIQVTGKFGYSEVPKIVEQLATLLVIKTMKTKYPDIEVLEEEIGDYAVTYKKSSDLNTAIEDLYSLLGADDDYSSTATDDILYT